MPTSLQPSLPVSLPASLPASPRARRFPATLLLATCAGLLLAAAAPAYAQQATVRVPGASIDARGDTTTSTQTRSADVQTQGGTTTIRNGVITNTQTGPGARATMNIGGRTVEGNQTIANGTGTGANAPRGERPRTGAAAGSGVQNGNDFVNQELPGAAWAKRDLRNANITNTNLHGADLSGANLAAASLVNVDLTGARLAGANLRGANVVNVDLEGADLSQATWVDGRTCRAGSIGRCL